MSAHRTRSSRARIAAALAAAAIATAAFAGGAGGVAGAAAPRASEPVLEERMRGEAAIRALGDRLPQVATANGLTTAALRSHLRSDDMLWVGESGTLLFVDEGLADHGHAEVEHAEIEANSPTWASHAPADAFTLRSRPGASRVIYLDFDGHDSPGGGWTGTPGAPYDTDGRPSTFSDAERRVIIDVWRHVAEDFAPFAIDVTTADPGIDAIRRDTSSDPTYGTRVVVTPTKTDCGSCGGVAYLGVYDSIGTNHDHYQPAWVYIAGTNAKSIAEAVSHEAGHNLGLRHDGVVNGPGYYSGHGDWAPIMGVGYYEPISQWSRGEYAGADNTEDDFVVMTNNGGLLAGDDHGGSASTATPLAPVVDVVGVIGANGDVDAFSFTTDGGLLSLTAAPTSVGPNVDLAVRVTDAGGTLVAGADPAGLAAELAVTLEAGSYTVLVDGVGAGDPATNGYSDYGSVGRYHLAGLLPSGQTVENRAPTASLQASTTSGTAPLPIDFVGTGSDPDGDELTYEWAFGDGTTASGASAAHTFAESGSYTVALTVSDGVLSSTATTTITVDDPEPAVVAPSAPTLAASESGGAVSLGWNAQSSVVTYEIHRESQHRNGSFRGLQRIGTVDGATTTFADTPGSGTFRYHVVAINSGGSARSNDAEVTVASSGGGGTKGKGGARSGSMKAR